MYCFGWANSPDDRTLATMRSDFQRNGSPTDFPKDDFPPQPPGPKHALAWATSPEHGKRLQRLSPPLHRVH
jgi:hypothetical protein